MNKNLGKHKLHNLLKEFFEILDTEEESDNGNVFHPVHISSCRVMKTIKVDEILNEIKEIIGYEKK